MKQPTNTDKTLNNSTTNHSLKSYKIKILTVNVNGFSNFSKRTKIFNFLKTNKIDITIKRNTFYQHDRKTIAKRVD